MAEKRGVKVTVPPDDRAQRLVDNPSAYVAEARRRARQQVEREMAREPVRRRRS